MATSCARTGRLVVLSGDALPGVRQPRPNWTAIPRHARGNLRASHALRRFKARSYVFNATVVPAHGPHGIPDPVADGQNMPVGSTLNAYDGLSVTSNMAIVPNANGSIDAYADGLTHLILDISDTSRRNSLMSGPRGPQFNQARPRSH